MHIPIKSGAIVPLLIMLPNLVWFLVPHPASDNSATVPLALNIAENAGRIAILVIPFFYSLKSGQRFSGVALVVAGLALAIYYAAWIRYFAGGSAAELMRASLVGIPLLWPWLRPFSYWLRPICCGRGRCWLPRLYLAWRTSGCRR
jgi:hypothetical protein